MQKLGLTIAERRAYERALRRPYERSFTVEVLNLDGKVLSNITTRRLDGQVVVDQTAEITRSLSMTLFDPNHALSFDTDSPDDGALYADRMVRVTYRVYVEALAKHVACVVFVGPITRLHRSGKTVDIEAQGKEALAMGTLWRPLQFQKGTRLTYAIRVLLGERAGEKRMSIPDLNQRLPKPRSLDRFETIWKPAQGFADALDRQLFYTGNGVATLRTLPGTPCYEFSSEGGDVVSDLDVSYELSEVKNVVLVLGAKVKGKPQIRYAAVAPDTHPLSPRRLGRDGAPRYLVETVEAPSIRTVKAAKARAERILTDRLRETVEVSFDTLPIPHLDAGDLVRITTDDGTFTFRLRQFTIPLGSGPMSVGYLRRPTVKRRRH